MKRIALCTIVAASVCVPAHAAGPLAFLAKDMVKSIVKSFVQSGYDKMLAAAGPCGVPLAPPGGGAIAGMLGGGRGLASMPRMGGMPGGGMARSGMPALPGMGTGAMPPEMERLMKDQMAQAEAMAAKERTADAPPGEGAAPPAAPDMAAAMRMMQDGKPLTAVEADELGTLLERMSAAMPAAATKCKPGEMKALIASAADSPMTGGMLRTMLDAMRDMQRKLDEARATFAKMSDAERDEYVETMAAEFRGWDKDNQQAFMGMVQTNFLGMPDAMKTQLLARLKQVS